MSTGSHQNDARTPAEVLADADFPSTEPYENDDFISFEETRSESTNDNNDDPQWSGGSDTILPEVLDDENDDMVVEKESPRGVK